MIRCASSIKFFSETHGRNIQGGGGYYSSGNIQVFKILLSGKICLYLSLPDPNGFWLNKRIYVKLCPRVIKKKCIQETSKLSTCADSYTKTKKIQYKIIVIIRCQVSSGVRLPVTCSMSLTPTATATAMDPLPANSPSIHSRMLLLILIQTLNNEL